MIDLISFVGVDRHTDLAEIVGLVSRTDYAVAHKQIPFNLEFGILYSESRAGREPRYPTYEEAMKMAGYFNNHNVSFSVHLCGREAIEGFIEQTDDIVNLCQKADRIQLNFNAAHYKDEDKLDDFIKRLIELTSMYTIIIQDNKSKAEFVRVLKRENIEQENPSATYFNFLYDASGGFGKVIDKFHMASDYYYTGYAGGLNPENVLDIVKEIDKINDPANTYYIDMESGIRTEDWFDMAKVKNITQQVLDYL